MGPADTLQDAFSSVVARTQAVLSRSTIKHPRPLPEHSTARFAMLILLHGSGWPNHLLWERWQDAHQQGEVALTVHMKV